jgi:hypothetical protein
MEDKIFVRTPNPHDITPEETEQIAQAILDLNLDCEVRAVSQEREGYGVTLFEVLRISLAVSATWLAKHALEKAGNKILDVVIDWVRARFKGKKAGSKRAVYVSIYGPDGVVVAKVIKNATDEPEDRTQEERKIADIIKRQKGEKTSSTQ